MKLVYDGSRVAKLKASFTLEMNALLLGYQWLKSLCFSYGYASNISKLMNLEDDRWLYGMKSHNCHVFIQTLFPPNCQDLLSKKIWDILMKMNQFFRDKCFNKLHNQHMEKLETNII